LAAADADDRVLCRTPQADGTTRIPRWKFDCVRRALHEVLSEADEVPYKDLKALVGGRISDEERAALGSLGWHLTTVKLELEVRGEVERVPGVRPQRVRWRS